MIQVDDGAHVVISSYEISLRSLRNLSISKDGRDENYLKNEISFQL